MSQKIKRAIKAGIFSILAVAILLICNFIVRPVWNIVGPANYDSPNEFYDEPSNTIETVFLGSSQAYTGISPMKLYEDYGICAYNLSTDGQPIVASYYWLEEIYKYHSQTLDTVVLDASMFRRESDIAEYHKAMDFMRFSSAKIQLVKEYSKNFDDFLQNIIPLFYYHDRWKDLSGTDFLKLGYEPDLFFRGYYYTTTQIVGDVNSISDIHLPLLITDINEAESKLDETAVQYFEKIVVFCEDRNIQLILIKTPTEWTSSDHNAVQSLADIYGLKFIDFNIEPYYSEVEYNMAADSADAEASKENIHVNYYGAEKLTDYLGCYLIEECGNQDIRGNEKYVFMEKELDEYHKYDTFRQSLTQAVDPCAYIKFALEEWDCTIFISVKDDAATSLTEEQRAYFESIGLIELSQLTSRESYLAIVDNGNVITEQFKKDPKEKETLEYPIIYKGTMYDGTHYTITSGGYNLGDTSSIMIEDTEYSNNDRGLNIVVYDNNLHRCIDSSSFDTYAASERSNTFNEYNWEMLLDEGVSVSSLTGADRILYLYNRECENEKTAKIARLKKNEENGLTTYLMAFFDDEDIDIFITAQGNASEILTDTLRTDLSKLGLLQLSQLTYQDSYVAAIINGDITEEAVHYTTMPLELSSDKYSIKSIGREGSDDASSVIINGTEYLSEEDGIFIVIYDNITEMVVDTITFEPKTDDANVTGETAG